MSDAPVDPEFDALLLVSFGGPEGPDDVLPFLQNVTRGRGVPDERLEEVGRHYRHFGGVSPINQQNRELLAELRVELSRRAIDLPVYWGNRNWSPYLAEAIDQMRTDGVRRALAFFTSAYSSYSGCRQYRENVAAALTAAEAPQLTVERIGPYFNHRGFVDPFVDATVSAVGGLSPSELQSARLVFTTHSIPESMADSSGASTGLAGGAYVQQHREVAAIVAARVAEEVGATIDFDLVFQSRSGSPHTAWLEPDIGDHLRTLAATGCSAAVVVPIGFVSDHLEVLWDLDTQAKEVAEEVGLAMVRVATPGTDPQMVAMVADLVEERLAGVPMADRPRMGSLPPSPDRCAAGCCPNPRGLLPAIGGSEPLAVS